MMALRLPKYSNVVKTSRVDPVLYHYYPLVRYFLNKRLSMMLEALGERRFGRLLDAGCGGGVFLPELARRCDTLYAVDVHDRLGDVRRMTAAEGVKTSIHRMSLTALAFPDDFFDGIVCVSVLEFVPDLHAALDEIARVAAPGARVVLGTPADNVLVDAGYFCIRARPRAEVHTSTVDQILAEAGKRLSPVRVIQFPARVPPRLALYFVGEFSAT